VEAQRRAPAAAAAAARDGVPGEADLMRRDLEVKDAFVAHAEALIAEAAATRERLEDDGAAAQHALAEIHAEARRLHGAYAELARINAALVAERDAARRELDLVAPELAALRERSRALDAIEAGGWWRLRARLLPAIRLAARARRRRR
jgi:hypothetical protein